MQASHNVTATITEDTSETLHGWFWELYAVHYDSLTRLKPYQRMMSDLLNALDLQEGMVVLDYGCGTGNFEQFVLTRFVRPSITGVDSAYSMLRRAERKVPPATGIVFVQGDSPNAAGFPLAFCDRIVTSNVLYTLPNPVATLSELRDLLKPNGIMVHATPQTRFNPMSIFWSHCRMCRGGGDLFSTLQILPALIMVRIMNIWIVKNGRETQNFWSQQDLISMMTDCGLTVVDIHPTYAGQDWLVQCRRG